MLARYWISLAIVGSLVVATAGLFVFARPGFDRERGSEMVDFSEVRHYSAATVRAAFASHGISLREASRFGGFVTFSTETRPLRADALQVVVGPPSGAGSFGPELEPYDERFGNVLVTYGGSDAALVERVDAAVDALR